MNRGRVSSGICHSRAPHVAVQVVLSKLCTRTYNNTPKNTATYVHTGWVGTEKLRHHRVHGEATECVVFVDSVGDIPRGVNRPELNPAGLGGLSEDPADTWRVTGDPPDLGFTSNPPGHYDSLVIRRAGQTDDKAQGPEGRFTFNGGPV